MPCSYDMKKLKRQSIRLKDYNYSQPGVYFVTICTWDRECLFGEIIDAQMRLNELGEIATQCWKAIPKHFSNVELDEFIVMPNHIHGIVSIIDRRGTACRAPTHEKFGRPVSGSLSTIIRSFKSATSKRINELRKRRDIPVWQRNYYEHVIRDENDLFQIRQYIRENPLKWALDPENPFRRAFNRVIENHSSTLRCLAE